MMDLDFNQIKVECDKIANKVLKEESKKLEQNGFRYAVHNSDCQFIEPMYDVCGGAYIKFTDKRSKFFREYKKYMSSIGRADEYLDVFNLYCHSSRQEASINKAIAEAVNEYLNTLNSKTIVISYID